MRIVERRPSGSLNFPGHAFFLCWAVPFQHASFSHPISTPSGPLPPIPRVLAAWCSNVSYYVSLSHPASTPSGSLNFPAASSSCFGRYHFSMRVSRSSCQHHQVRFPASRAFLLRGLAMSLTMCLSRTLCQQHHVPVFAARAFLLRCAAVFQHASFSDPMLTPSRPRPPIARLLAAWCSTVSYYAYFLHPM